MPVDQPASGSALQPLQPPAQVFVGVGASRVRDMFKKARSSAPCILFIDEFDGIGQQRSSSAMGNDGARRSWVHPLAFMVVWSGWTYTCPVLLAPG